MQHLDKALVLSAQRQSLFVLLKEETKQCLWQCCGSVSCQTLRIRIRVGDHVILLIILLLTDQWKGAGITTKILRLPYKFSRFLIKDVCVSEKFRTRIRILIKMIRILAFRLCHEISNLNLNRHESKDNYCRSKGTADTYRYTKSKFACPKKQTKLLLHRVGPNEICLSPTVLSKDAVPGESTVYL